MKVTPNVILFVFVIILIISIMLTLWIGSSKNFNKTSIGIFINILVGLGIFLTFIFNYITIHSKHKREQLDTIQEVHHINDLILNNLLNEIDKSSHVIPSFVISLNPLMRSECNNLSDSTNPEACIRKMVLSNYIFSIWEDVIISKSFLDIDISYIFNFLQRANSNQLYEQWKINKYNFKKITQTFGDLLFEYGLNIKNQTVEEYIITAKKLMEDLRYKELIKV